jgi:hypothetical protein
MWRWMHKKKQRRDEYQITEDEYREICKQPIHIRQMVVDAVTHYNNMVSLSRNYESNDGNDLLIKEAEEQNAKVFLDGLLDIIEKRE